jgi:hypothetical protein
MKKTTLVLLVFLASYSLIAQNTCATAITTTAGLTSVGNVDGTEIPTPICAANGTGATAGEWYIYTPSQDYTVTITTDLAVNTGKDTRVHIYTGTCGSLNCYAGDDDSGTGFLSIVTFNVVQGTTYYIAWDNRWSSTNFDFELIEQTFVALPIAFTTSTIPSSSTICSVTDMNGDYLDDIVTVETNQMTVLTQQSSGGFVSTVYPLPLLSANPTWSIAAGDIDKNGFNDLVFGSGSRVAIIKANATGTGYTEIAYPQNIFTQRTNFVDINNDGNLDLWACHDVAQSHAYRNDGAGNLNFDISLMPTLPVGGNYQSMWTDYDNDGDIDMYLSKCRGGAPVGDSQRINLLYKNNGDGTFTESGAIAGVNDGSQSWSTTIEDFDNDGDMDFLLSNISDTNKFYLNNGDGTFTDIYASTGIDPQVGSWELQSGDFNNDGWVDFFWQNGKEMYLNNGDLTFTGYDLGFSEGGIGDLNNDGFLDVQYGNNVYYNIPNANNWIKINLQGVISNGNGIGARVKIYGSWGMQTREIRSGHGFSHQSTLNAHFGLGSETVVDQVIINWPSGIVDVINNPNSNEALTVVEGSYPLSLANLDGQEIVIYPNPATTYLNISNLNLLDVATIKIYNNLGQLIKEVPNNLNTINIESLSKGIYILSIETNNNKKYSESFIKK